MVNLVPKSLFEQFRRVANVFFLVVSCVSFTPLAPYRAVSVLLPLVVVVGATMAKEAVEDWRRKQQVEIWPNSAVFCAPVAQVSASEPFELLRSLPSGVFLD